MLWATSPFVEDNIGHATSFFFTPVEVRGEESFFHNRQASMDIRRKLDGTIWIMGGVFVPCRQSNYSLA
jgi:hypothetical protein